MMPALEPPRHAPIAELHPAAEAQPFPFVAVDGTRMGGLFWPAPGEMAGRPVIFAVHGLGGAASDFDPLGRVLAGSRRLPVYAPELRGQGNDPDVTRRGNLADLREVVADLSGWLEGVRERHPGSAVFGYGESMGAMLLLHLAAGLPAGRALAGIILASPVIDLKVRMNRLHHALFNLLLRAIPQRRLDFAAITRKLHRGLQPRLTRDDAYEDYLRQAPHRVEGFSARFLHTLSRMIGGSAAVAPRVSCPALVVYAGHDIFIPPALVEGIFERLGSADKTLRLFPESYHLLLHDHDSAEVLATVEQWLDAHTAALPD